ncbi:MAG: hypothetical protein GX785_02070 [Armatimonadetes bacterium]|jgi:hypothetical protein|nr:hypothetical protein [Armatimonadota bacterium]
MLIVAAGFEPRQRILYRVSRKKLLAALRVAHQMQPRVSPQETVRVLLAVDRGAPHQEFLDRAGAEVLARWALQNADPWDCDDMGDDVFEAMVAGVI